VTLPTAAGPCWQQIMGVLEYRTASIPRTQSGSNASPSTVKCLCCQQTCAVPAAYRKQRTQSGLVRADNERTGQGAEQTWDTYHRCLVSTAKQCSRMALVNQQSHEFSHTQASTYLDPLLVQTYSPNAARGARTSSKRASKQASSSNTSSSRKKSEPPLTVPPFAPQTCHAPVLTNSNVAFSVLRAGTLP